MPGHGLVALLTGVAMACSSPTEGPASLRDPLEGPLTVARQGSFFVGGETKTVAAPGRGGGGEITVHQMYVQYQEPAGDDAHFPVVMVHGCCLSSKTWETTPDGRMGWDEYFVRRGRPVYLADQVARARSGFDPSAWQAVGAGAVPPGELPMVLSATHQIAWTVFRFGPTYGEAFPDGQFPIEAVDGLYEQLIPDLSTLLPADNPTWANMAVLAAQLDGAILMGHSQSAFFPQRAALKDASGVRGIVSLEGPCPGDLDETAIAVLATVPTLIMFGDHLADVAGGPANWAEALAGCEAYGRRVNEAGGDVVLMHLPAMGIHGNSHMFMQDRNNLELADLILGWIDGYVGTRRTPL